jgi:hypothetical protein
MDETTMHCNNLAVKWGWRGFAIVNLWPLITKPEEKNKAREDSRYQPQNDAWLRQAWKYAEDFVIATGDFTPYQKLAEAIQRTKPARLHYGER